MASAEHINSTSQNEALAPRTGEVSIGVIVSPEGRECLGMTSGEQVLVLLGVNPLSEITSTLAKLKTYHEIEARVGFAFDKKESLRQKKPVTSSDPEKSDYIGFWVSPEDYDYYTSGKEALENEYLPW